MFVYPACLEERRVAFSCKCQFYLSCAKAYGQEWVETVKGMLHPRVTYRHLILTVPEGLRTLIYQHPNVAPQHPFGKLRTELRRYRKREAQACLRTPHR